MSFRIKVYDFACCDFPVFRVRNQSEFTSPDARQRSQIMYRTKGKNFGATPAAVGSSDASLKEVNTSVSQLSELIGCVNQGLKINNLSWRIRRDWLIKRFEYYQMRQVFAQYLCYFTNAVQAEKLMVKVNDEINSRQKKPALQNVSTLQNYALRAKQCSDRAAHFKHIEPELKQGFQEISVQTDGLLEKIEQLRTVIKKLPN